MKIYVVKIILIGAGKKSGKFTSDNDIFIQYDDRWAQRGNMIDESGSEYLQTGYPMGLQFQHKFILMVYHH